VRAEAAVAAASLLLASFLALDVERTEPPIANTTLQYLPSIILGSILMVFGNIIKSSMEEHSY
jgi:hypothetical protein